MVFDTPHGVFIMKLDLVESILDVKFPKKMERYSFYGSAGMDDYDKFDWEWSMFDPNQRKKRRETIFPQERKKAFEMGKALAERE